MPTVLLIDDDYELYSIINDYAARTEFQVEHAGDAETGLSRLFEASGKWDLVVLDVMLPGLSGFDVLERIRNSPKTRDLPVLMLTALDGEQELVSGLDAGADDYLAKPFSLRELAARLRAIFRRIARSGLAPESEPAPGSLVIKRSALLVELDGKRVRLTPSEMRILEMLAEEPGKTVGRDRLSQMLPGGQHNTRGLDMAVSRLRKKLGRGERGGRIQAVWGEGYVFLMSGESS